MSAPACAVRPCKACRERSDRYARRLALVSRGLTDSLRNRFATGAVRHAALRAVDRPQASAIASAWVVLLARLLPGETAFPGEASDVEGALNTYLADPREGRFVLAEDRGHAGAFKAAAHLIHEIASLMWSSRRAGPPVVAALAEVAA